MVTTLKKNNNKYYCANCRIQQQELQPFCQFCGYEFSNIVSIMDEEAKLKAQVEVENESNVYGRD